MPLFENFPYTNFHDLNLDWLLRIVKKFSDTLEGLDDEIAEIVKEQLDELNLEQIILETVTKYGLAINVIAPPNNLQPADPTGAEESTVTIQGCIDYANAQGGGVVFFPAGRYLTGSLTLKSNVALVGFDMYTSRLTLKGGASAPLISGDVQNCFIGGLTFDGNSEVQVDDITNVALTCNNVGFNNVRFTGGYILAAITGSGGDVWADGLTFGTCVQNALVTMGTGDFRFTNMKFNDLSAVGGVNVIGINTDSGIYDFQSVATCTVCCDISGDGNIVHCKVENAGTAVQDNGERNQIVSYGDMVKAVYENFSLTVSGDFNIGSETADINLEGKNVNVAGTDFKMGQTEPTTYRTPTQLNKFFNSVPFKSPDGTTYNMLVEGAEDIDNLSGYISAADYGAVGDGVTNDTEAIKNAVNSANVNKMPLMFEYGKKYLMDAESIVCHESINFNNSEIIVNSGSVSVFDIMPENSNDYTLDQSSFSKNQVLNSELYGKIFMLRTPISLGVRSGTGEAVLLEKIVVTDNNGYITNNPLEFNIINGTYTVQNAHSIGKRLVFKNAKISYNTDTTPALLRIQRSNVHVDGLLCDSAVNNTDYAGGVVEASKCAFVEYSNVYGYNPSGPDDSGYLLGAGNVSDLYIHDCVLGNKQGGSWGSIGISRAINLKVERVQSNRLDVHYQQEGFYEIVNCCANYITIPCVKRGVMRVKDCVLFRNVANAFVETRGDVNLSLSGELILEGLKNDDAPYLLIVNMRGDNTGLDNLNPYEFNITFKNCTVNNNSLMYMRAVTENNADNIFIHVLDSVLNGARIWINVDTDVQIPLIEFDSVNGFNGQISGNVDMVRINKCKTIGNLYVAGNVVIITNNDLINVGTHTVNSIVFCNNVIRANTSNALTATHGSFSGNVLPSGSSENIESWNKQTT